VKHIDEYRKKDLAEGILDQIRSFTRKPWRFMEVCGGHTVAIRKFGIPSLLPPEIKLLSGPGCPVCVTGKSFIDKVIILSQRKDTIVTTFGDLMRVPGSDSTLEKEKASGADIRMVYSPLECLEIARENPAKQVIFPGIGFETTAPSTAVTILEAEKEGLKNLFLLSAHKIMPPAMEILAEGEIGIDGFICPGHVSTVTGTGIYSPLPEKYGLGCVITGFEPVDILQGIFMLVSQLERETPGVEIQYSRAVKPEGNVKAQHIMNEVFELHDDWWRGLGTVPGSGLKLKKRFSAFDAELNFKAEATEPIEDKGCLCGEVLKGIKLPVECKLFGKACTPENPTGACMVSTEGACQAYYRYEIQS